MNNLPANCQGHENLSALCLFWHIRLLTAGALGHGPDTSQTCIVMRQHMRQGFIRHDHSLFTMTPLLLEGFGGTPKMFSAQENDYRKHAVRARLVCTS